MTDYSVEYLQRLYDATTKFENAFEAWMATQVEGDHMSSRGLFPTVWVKDGQDVSEVRRLELELASAAGLAARAVSVTGAYIFVDGKPPIDPVSNWSTMSSPKALLVPRDIRMTAATIRGRLDGMIADAKSRSNTGLPVFSPARLHPVVWSSAAEQWTAHHYRIAVREAAEGLTQFWREKLGRKDVDGRKFWQQTFSSGEPKEGQPKLVWPGDTSDMLVKDMQSGLCPLATSLRELAEGLTSTVRNATTHSTNELSEQEAMERLASYNYLARLLDQCEVRWAGKDEELTQTRPK